MNRRHLSSVLAAAVCASLLATSGAQEGPPPMHGDGPPPHQAPGFGRGEFERPPGPEDFRRVAEFLRSRGDEALADQLMQSVRQGPDGPQEFRRRAAEEAGEAREERGKNWREERWQGPIETLMRARGVHERLVDLERERAEIERKAAQSGSNAEAVARMRESYRESLEKWASEARPSLPQVRRRLHTGIEELEGRTDSRPGMRALAEAVRANMDDIDAFLGEPPESDQELADGLRERLGRVVGNIPREGFFVGPAIAEEKRSTHIRREIDLLRRRLDALEAELEGVAAPPEAPTAPQAPAPAQAPREKAPEPSRRRTALPPLPPAEAP